jgi:hypothetical protein
LLDSLYKISPARTCSKAKLTKIGSKIYGGTGIRARVKRITTAYANHYTIPPDHDFQFIWFLFCRAIAIVIANTTGNMYVRGISSLGRAVGSQSAGRGIETPIFHFFVFWGWKAHPILHILLTLDTFFVSQCVNRQRVRVVKELVLKANGLCPREFKSRRCRFFSSFFLCFLLFFFV